MQPETNGVRTWQWVVTVIVIIVLILIGYYAFNKKSVTPDDVNTTDTNTAVNTSVNRVVVSDQFPGNIVYVSSVQLANPGFVVIQKDSAGKPGMVIGSQYFDKGINPGKITLSSGTVDGGTYYAVLYTDTDGNKVFDAVKDMPLRDANGNIIMKVFRAATTIVESKG